MALFCKARSLPALKAGIAHVGHRLFEGIKADTNNARFFAGMNRGIGQTEAVVNLKIQDGYKRHELGDDVRLKVLHKQMRHRILTYDDSLRTGSNEIQNTILSLLKLDGDCQEIEGMRDVNR